MLLRCCSNTQSAKAKNDTLASVGRIHPYKRKESGAAMIMAIVILVVCSLLGAAMVSLVQVGQRSSAREVISVRALFSAYSGVNRTLECIRSGNTCADCSGTFNWNNTLAGLNSCSAMVSCNLDVQLSNNSVVTEEYYTVESVGRCASDMPATRTVQVKYRKEA